MKKILCFILMISTLPVGAYQTGSVSRPQFNAVSQKSEPQNGKEKSAIPGQQPVQTRSFTSYGAKEGRSWRKGVQTNPVKTPDAKSATAPKVKTEGTTQTVTTATGTTKITKTYQGKSAPASTKVEKVPSKKEDNKNGQAAAQETPDPSAMMQQLQGMMGALGGGAAGGAQASKGAPNGENVATGMPDLSALMNMAGQANTGKK